MNTFQQILTNDKDETITVTTGTYGELVDIKEKLAPHGWRPKPWVTNSRPTSERKNSYPTPNLPKNVSPCPHHPDAGMGHDKKNPGQYYCRAKVGEKWCGYKADKNGIVRSSIIDIEEEKNLQLGWDELDF